MLRDRRLAALIAGVTVSKVGDGMLVVALPLQTLRMHGNLNPALAIALIEAAPFALAVVVSLVAGSRNRQFSPRAVMSADCVLRCATFCGLGIAAILGHLPLAVMGTALLFGSALRLMATSNQRLTATELAGERGRFAANGLMGTIDGLALYIAGPALGGVLAVAASPGFVLLLDGLTFVVLLVIVLIVAPTRTKPHAADPAPASGWAIMRRTPVVAWLLVIVVAFNLFYMPIEVALPLLVRGPLGASEAALGYVWTGFGIGALLGALATNTLRRAPQGTLLAMIIGAWGVCALGLAVAPTVETAGLALAIGGLVYAPFTPVAYSLVQSKLAPSEQQPVLTLWVAATAVAAPVGLLLGGPLVQLCGIRGGILLSAILTLCMTPLAIHILGRPDRAAKAATGQLLDASPAESRTH